MHLASGTVFRPRVRGGRIVRRVQSKMRPSASLTWHDTGGWLRAAPFLIVFPQPRHSRVGLVARSAGGSGGTPHLALLISTVIGMSITEHSLPPTVQDIESRMPFPGLVR